LGDVELSGCCFIDFVTRQLNRTTLLPADAEIMRAVIRALGQLRDKRALAPLLARLDDPDAAVRRAVIDSLSELGDKRAVARLLAKLDDPDEDSRWAATVADGSRRHTRRAARRTASGALARGRSRTVGAAAASLRERTMM
jgi:HEAT repeat protein